MPPDLKRASWLELFYDVAFVALVAQLTYLGYAHHHSFTDIFSLFIIGYIIFLTWWATTANRNLQPNETTGDKLFIQLQMVAAFFMSVTMASVFEGDYTGFFVTLAVLRILQGGMLLRMYLLHPETRPKTYNILEGFFLGASLWLVGAFLPAPYNFILFSMALIIDILTPLTKGKGNTRRYLNVYHLQERLGLFLMLVIGESMIVVALANTTAGLSAVEPTVVLSGLIMMVSLWWLYFAHADLHSGVRPKNLFLFLHSHGFLFGSIILLSIGYKLMISNVDILPALVFTGLGTIGVLMTLGVIRLVLYSSWQRVVLWSLGALLVSILIVLVGISEARPLIATMFLAGVLAVTALVDVFFEQRRPLPPELELPSVPPTATANDANQSS